SCSAPFFAYPIVNANGVAQYGPGLSTATGQGNDLTFGSTIGSSATAIPNGLHVSTDYALGSDLTSAPRFAFQTVLGADAAFSDALTLTTTGTVFDIFPTVTNIDQSPGVHAAVQINF